MAEKLDNSARNIIISLLPEGWNYYYARAFFIIYEELPALELLRAISNENINQSTKEIIYNKIQYLCVYISRNLYHWQGNSTHILFSQGFMKGFECSFIVSCKDYSQGCRILMQSKKKLT